MPSPFGGQSQQRWGDNTVSQNEYMRDLLLTDMSGKVCNTADARKKGWIALAFVKPGEAASRELLPLLQKMADAYKESGKLTLWVVSVSDDTGETTRALVAETSLTAPVLLDRDGYHAMLYGVTTFPTFVVANGEGMVQRKVAGVKPAALNDASSKYAVFAQVEPVPVVEGAPMPVIPAPVITEPALAAPPAA